MEFIVEKILKYNGSNSKSLSGHFYQDIREYEEIIQQLRAELITKNQYLAQLQKVTRDDTDDTTKQYVAVVDDLQKKVNFVLKQIEMWVLVTMVTLVTTLMRKISVASSIIGTPQQQPIKN